MENKKLFNVTKEMELETELLINQNLYDLKVIDYKTYQVFTDYILSRMKKTKNG